MKTELNNDYKKVRIKQFEAIKSFYHSLIDGIKDSIYAIGWKKDIYLEYGFLITSISKRDLFMIN